eukprot:1619444-Pleurochrysis_carterae.AAC.7
MLENPDLAITAMKLPLPYVTVPPASPTAGHKYDRGGVIASQYYRRFNGASANRRAQRMQEEGASSNCWLECSLMPAWSLVAPHCMEPGL